MVQEVNVKFKGFKCEVNQVIDKEECSKTKTRDYLFQPMDAVNSNDLEVFYLCDDCHAEVINQEYE